jgi:hypothetical protein
LGCAYDETKADIDIEIPFKSHLNKIDATGIQFAFEKPVGSLLGFSYLCYNFSQVSYALT